jgi:hypothetical protein
MRTLAFHPLADIFPWLRVPSLMSSWPISLSMGCTSQLLIYEDKILDGRNRYRACEAAGGSRAPSLPSIRSLEATPNVSTNRNKQHRNGGGHLRGKDDIEKFL